MAAQHQSLLHFVGNAPWSDAAVLSKVRDLTLPVLEKHGPVEAWIVDDTGFPKKGKHSVGVARQYCGQLGKQDNCHGAVSLSVANHHASLPIAYRLYLPQEWADDEDRRQQAGVPKDIEFATKPEIALAQIAQALQEGVPQGVVLMDAGYGVNTALREGVTALGLSYAAGIQPQTSVGKQGEGPLPPKSFSGNGRPPKLMRRDKEHRPLSVKELALGLPESDWFNITCREGACEPLSSRFARVRVRPAHRDYDLTAPRPEEWLLIEWPEREAEPTKYWFSTLPEDIDFTSLVGITKLRWRIERDYLDLKQEIGIGHYEGRGWRGFHHHATLCIAAYAFLRTGDDPPSGSRRRRVLYNVAHLDTRWQNISERARPASKKAGEPYAACVTGRSQKSHGAYTVPINSRKIHAKSALKCLILMVPRGGIEPPTRGFSVRCSTTELPGHSGMPYKLARRGLYEL